MTDWTLRREALEIAVRCGAGPHELIAVAGQIAEYLEPEAVAATQKVRPKQVSRWTAERRDYLFQHYPAGDAIRGIADALNLMPGPLVTTAQVFAAAHRFGLLRNYKNPATTAMNAAKAAKRAAASSNGAAH